MDQEFLKKFPVKRHPDAGMTSKYVALYIQEEPESFVQLQRLMSEEKDLAEVMRHFYEFLARRGYDSGFSESSVFGALCDEAKSAVKRK